MENLLWIGDAACGSGFGKASRYILEQLQHQYNVFVLGINFRGDPLKFGEKMPNYPVYPAMLGGDQLGFGRVGEMLSISKPAVVVVQTNPWNVPVYRNQLNLAKYKGPLVGIIAVEGKNCNGLDLNHLDYAIFWNEFSRIEAINGGMTAPNGVVPLGVDLEMFAPGDRAAARERLGLPISPDDFVVFGVNRNQNRKRIDLSILYFAEWIHGGVPIGQRSVKTRVINDAYLYLHTVAGSSTTVDVDQLANYTGVIDRMILLAPKDVFNGTPEWAVKCGHVASNVGLSTSLGEGWGLNSMEGMACDRPQIGGDFSAFGEWAKDAMCLVPCYDEGVMPDVHNMIGGIPDRASVINALEAFYRDPARCREYGERGLALVRQPEYRWENIAARFAEEIKRGQSCLISA